MNMGTIEFLKNHGEFTSRKVRAEHASPLPYFHFEGDQNMNAANHKNHLSLSAKVVYKQANPEKSGEIFTLRFEDKLRTNAANRRPARECGPDLFFAEWDFVDEKLNAESA